ncbi:SH2 domain-containing adapter protein B-like isoform X3 [Dromaius novaehollandiae]|uniref:SH2 domain-containing adapter protein B-like isoform X3 n=1 Tax=Dromaius novaehollandiae TaxID=8790 RepID=UPI00311DCF60
MAKWLNKYFSLGNNKTKSPLRPDYHDKRDGASSTSGSDGLHYHYCILPGFLHHHLCGNTSDLLCAYHAQKDRDFEDPYSRPGSSLCKLCAVYHLDYYVPENLDEAAPKAFSSSCCARTSMLSAATPIGSPRLFHSHSKNQLALLPNIKYTSSEHHLIKVESGCSHAPDSAASMVTWSSLGSVAKKLNKGLEQLKTPAPPTKKEKVSIADDYSDPFDAKSELNKMGKGEDTGYMEPYEAQRIMTGICFIWADWTQSGSHKTLVPQWRRRIYKPLDLVTVSMSLSYLLPAEFQRQGNVKSQQKTMQNYDTPYEPEHNGVESDSENVVSQRLQEKKFPQDDDRPADEYDQPWEWNTVTIPALADSPVHSFQLGDQVYLRTWKDEPLVEKWRGPYLVLLTTNNPLHPSESSTSRDVES